VWWTPPVAKDEQAESSRETSSTEAFDTVQAKAKFEAHMQGEVGEQLAEVAEKVTEKPAEGAARQPPLCTIEKCEYYRVAAEGAGKRVAAREPHPAMIEKCEYYQVATLAELREEAEDLEVQTAATMMMNRKELVAYLTRYVQGK
jgi:hypothetical protein